MGFAPSSIELTSTAFRPLGRIPKKHTGEGEDVSPALAWSNVPKGTRAFALICYDPDAPLVLASGYGFTHWVLYNIPGSATRLAEGDKSHTSGVNSFGKLGYGGPLPPEQHGVHHYYFWLLALGSDVWLPEGLSMTELCAAVEPDVLGTNRLIGTYSRPS